MDELKNRFIELSPEAKLKEKQESEREEREQEAARESEKKKVVESRYSVFDEPSFISVEGRLHALEAFVGPNFILLSTPSSDGNTNNYTVGYLKGLFKQTLEYAKQLVRHKQSLGMPPGLTADEAVQLNASYANAGITSRKVSEQSKLGLRGCLIECIQQYAIQSKDGLQRFKSS